MALKVDVNSENIWKSFIVHDFLPTDGRSFAFKMIYKVMLKV